MVRVQKGACAICKQTKKLVVDHNHTTKQIRGLLCSTCNLGLGMFQDNMDLLESAIRYLYEQETRDSI